MDLSLITFNVYNNAATFDQRLPLILDTLRRADADVVALQEVPPGRGVTEALARDIDHAHWAEVTFVRPDDGWTEALAILSRLPISAREAVNLRQGVPNCLRVRIAAGEGDFDLYNCHLHPRDSGLRQQEAARILDHMDREPGLAAVLCGDFNAVPSGRTMELLFSRLRSAYEMKHNHHPATTFPTPLRADLIASTAFSARREARPEDSSGGVGAVLDYVLIRRGEFGVKDAITIGDEPAATDPTLWPSDHYGLLVRLTR